MGTATSFRGEPGIRFSKEETDLLVERLKFALIESGTELRSCSLHDLSYSVHISTVLLRLLPDLTWDFDRSNWHTLFSFIYLLTQSFGGGCLIFSFLTMRSFERVTLGLIIVQQIIDELGQFSYVTKYLAARTPSRRLRRARTYVMSTRIPDQIHHLYRLVSISDESYLHNLRMDRNAFGRLCYMLQYSGGMTPTKNLNVAGSDFP